MATLEPDQSEPTLTADAVAAGLQRVPHHIAIIMDGNNRWAKRKRLPGAAGHRAGVDAVRKVIEACGDYGIRALTLFAFSSENWQRPKEEVGALMSLFLTMLTKEVKRLHKNNIRLRVMGERSRFSEAIQEKIADAEALTENNQGFTLVIAADYGGRWDIVEAARKLAEQAVAGQLDLNDVSEQQFQQHLCLADLPPPDLLIRTSGEQRISNFMLWQAAYSEFYFTDLLWPDFGKEALQDALLVFNQRDRRYGGRDTTDSSEQG